jgi:gamma-glutamyl phosphate reductase
MPYIKIHQDKAIDKAKLLEICPFKAIELDGGNLAINSGCRMCRICVKKYSDIFEFVNDAATESVDKSQWRGIAVVAEIEEAVSHIASYGSGHSECIVADEEAAADYFVKAVDAACVYVNVPTSFTDGGEFGLGAEIGISTQKLHARGPMGLQELNTYKWVVSGEGQTRK